MLSRDEIIAEWNKVFEEKRILPDILALKERYPDKRSVYISFNILEEIMPQLSIELLANPEEILNAGTAHLIELFLSDKEVIPNTVHIRITDLPDEYNMNIREIRSAHLNRLISIGGIIRKVSEVRPRVIKAFFRCSSCNHYIVEMQESIQLKKPKECYAEQGGCGKKDVKFFLDPVLSQFIDFQRIEVEDTTDMSNRGTQLLHMLVHIDDDLTGIAVPGMRVIVTGILKYVQNDQSKGIFNIFLEAVYINKEKMEYEEIDITPADIEEIQRAAADPEISNNIVRSIAPTIAEHEKIKEAIALQLFGGVKKILKDGIHIKGDIHILLLGDPGTAKSQLLRYVANLAPRGIYASGKSTTSAGLTAAAVRDDSLDGRWTLEAGLLVLANKGIACIDEMDKMSVEDTSSMHEALEQQTVSIAKAGITATLPTECAVLAAANPNYGRFDPNESVLSQTKLPPTLLTRFDVIFPVRDEPNSERDEKIASHILRSHRVGEIDIAKDRRAYIPENEDYGEVTPVFTPEFLKKYISYARNNIFPVLNPEAESYLIKYYVEKRSRAMAEKAPIPITPRQLEAAIRLAEASAKMRLSNVVTVEDAQRAESIEEYFMKKTSEGGYFDVDLLNTGISTKKRNKFKDIESIINDLNSENSRPPTSQEIYESAHNNGMEIKEDEMYALLDTLNKQGFVYCKFTEKGKKVYMVTKEQ